MLALIVLVVSIGVVDSLNPSTIAPALYLATAKDARSALARFTAGVFAVYLGGGLVLALGPGQLLRSALPHPDRRIRHLIELGLGAGTLLLAIVLWLERERVVHQLTRAEGRIERSAVTLGAGIMALELPTALPYFAVIAAIVDSGAAVPTQVALLVLFNVAFVAPLLAILALRQLAGEDAERRLEALRGRLHRHAPALIPALVLVVAIALVALGGAGLLTT